MTTEVKPQEKLLTDLARVRAQFQLEAIMAAMGVKVEREQIDVVTLDNQHKDGVE